MTSELKTSGASKTPKPEPETWPGRRIAHEEFARDLAARREAAGNPELPRNAGTRRTASKRALLEAIAATGAKW